MPHAQVVGFPVASGDGRLRHKAAVACRANWAYSSSKCARQKASVSATMVLKAASMGLGTRSDLGIRAILTSCRLIHNECMASQDWDGQHNSQVQSLSCLSSSI